MKAVGTEIVRSVPVHSADTRYAIHTEGCRCSEVCIREPGDIEHGVVVGLPAKARDKRRFGGAGAGHAQGKDREQSS
jgi:hypothetical protein